MPRTSLSNYPDSLSKCLLSTGEEIIVMRRKHSFLPLVIQCRGAVLRTDSRFVMVIRIDTQL